MFRLCNLSVETSGPIVIQTCKMDLDSCVTSLPTMSGSLFPVFTNRRNAGVNNYMVYLTGDIPVGLYSSSNLANIGLGHGAIDGGVGYTYLDQKTGHEFSVVTGLTGNFTNPATNYTSGIDWHLDWGASQFLSKQLLVGLVGYVYDQLTPTAAARRSCDPSSRASSALARKSATSFRPGTACRATLI
jgi:hypothetical protein